MKTFILLLIVPFTLAVFAQENIPEPIVSPVLNSYETAQMEQSGSSGTFFINKRSDKSTWFYYNGALADWVTSSRNYYTLLFPEKLTSIFEDNNNPGTYNTGSVSSYSVGVIFSPYSDILFTAGHDEFQKEQPFRLDSIGISYNYMRFREDNIPDTLIINIFSPQKLLYYTDKGDPSGIPKGGSFRYDSVNNKGRDYSKEIVYLLTADDTITYRPRGRGILTIPVNLDISPSSYGNVVGVSWSYKPGHSYNITDTLNGDFVQGIPHSKINHFLYWNFNDLTDEDIEEFNNGTFIYGWNNATKYKLNSSFGPLYWRGSSFVGKRCIPEAYFKLTYDPDWQSSIKEINKNKAGMIYPNPSTQLITIDMELNHNQNLNFEVINSVGQVIYKGNEMAGKGSFTWSLNVSQLKSGFYTVRINNGESGIQRNFIRK